MRVIINPFDAKARATVDNAAAIERLDCEVFTKVRLLRDGLMLFDAVGEPYSADIIIYSRRASAVDLDALVSGPHIYVIDRGEVIINDGFGGKIDIDVTQEVLLSILSSDKPIGEIFNLPTARPYISMMMD